MISHSDSLALSADDARIIRGEVALICANPQFARWETSTSLLTYLVEQQLSGRGKELKETTVAREMYGLSDDYDPKLNSIVRVNANRLRLRLEDHYRVQRPSAVRIVLQRGAYTPCFKWLPASALDPSFETHQTESLPDVAMPTSNRVGIKSLGAARWPIRISIAAAGLAASLFAVVFFLHKQRQEVPRETVSIPVIRSIHPFGTSTVFSAFAEFSPDGQTLAFVSTPRGSSKKAIYLEGANSDEQRLLENDPHDETRPSWSPNGKQLAYLRLLKDGRKQVVIRTLATGVETQVAEIQGGPLWLCTIPHITWARDSQHLYTSASQTPGAPCGIVAIDLVTHRVTPLILPPAGIYGDLDPSVSPDGASVAFVRNYSYYHSKILLLPLNGGPIRELTPDVAEVMGFAWNSTGKSIVFASNRLDQERRLWELRVGTGELAALTDGSSSPTFPSLSPDESSIVYTEYRRESSIWRADRNGSVPVVDNGANNEGPVLSPDGRKLLFTSNHLGTYVVWISDISGQNAHRLMPGSDAQSGSAAWSPDGTLIAFECMQKSMNICLTDATGAHIVQVTEGPSNQSRPSWSHDGKSLYYTSDKTGIKEIYRQPLDSRIPQQLSHGGGDYGVESPDGRWLYMRRPQFWHGIVVLPLHPAQTNASGRDEAGRLLIDIPQNISYWQLYKDRILFIQSMAKNSDPFLMMHQVGTRKTEKIYSIHGYDGLDEAFFSSDIFTGTTFYQKEGYQVHLNLIELQPSTAKAVPLAASISILH